MLRAALSTLAHVQLHCVIITSVGFQSSGGSIERELQSVIEQNSSAACLDDYPIYAPQKHVSILASGAYSLLGCALSALPRALANMKDRWTDEVLAVNSQVRNTSSLEFRSWLKSFYFELRQASGKLTSCSLVLPDSGQGFSLEANICEDVDSGILQVVSSFNLDVNNRTVVQTDLHGSKSCDPFSKSVGYYCNKAKIEVDWHPAQQISADYDYRTEPWYVFVTQAANDTGYITYVPQFQDRAGRVGIAAAVVLKDVQTNHSAAVVQCSMWNDPLSKYFASLAGKFRRIFTYHRTSGLLVADSHSGKSGGGITPMNCGDPITERIGEYLMKIAPVSFTASTFPLLGKVRWDGDSASVNFNAIYSWELDWILVTADVPRCWSGYYLTSDIIPSYGYTCKNEEQRCRPGTFGWRLKFGHPCVECQEGFYSPDWATHVCTTCEPGKYQPDRGKTACITCPTNTYSYPGSRNVTDCYCQDDYFAEETGTACIACPIGAHCEGRNELPYAKKEFFAIGNRTGQYFRCVSQYTGNSCMQGSVADTNECEKGYIGAACLLCDRGSYRIGRECLACETSNGSYAAFETRLRIWFCIILVVFYLFRRVVNSQFKSLYIFFSFLQVFGIQSSFRVAWPSNIKLILRILSVSNLQVDFLIPTCEKEPGLPWKFLAYMLLPLFFLLVDSMLALLGYIRHHFRTKNYKAPNLLQTSGRAPQLSNIVSKSCESLEEACAKIEDLLDDSGEAVTNGLAEMHMHAPRPSSAFCSDFFAMFVINMRLMYLSICGRTFDMLRCTPLPDGSSRLSADPNLVCWTGQHLAFMPLVVISLVFFVVGTPLVYLVILLSAKKKGVLYTPSHLGRWRTLYGRFHSSFFFWELAIIFRRLSVVSIKSFLNIRLAEYQATGYLGNFQAGLTCLVMFFCSSAHTFCKPFMDDWLNVGEFIYLGCTFFSVLLGICFSAAKTDVEVNALERLFFLNLHVAFVAFVVFLYRDLESNVPWIARQRRRVTDAIENSCLPACAQRPRKSLEDQTFKVASVNLEPTEPIAYTCGNKGDSVLSEGYLKGNPNLKGDGLPTTPHEPDDSPDDGKYLNEVIGVIVEGVVEGKMMRPPQGRSGRLRVSAEVDLKETVDVSTVDASAPCPRTPRKDYNPSKEGLAQSSADSSAPACI